MEEHNKKDMQLLKESAEKKLEVWEKAMAGDSQAIILATIMRGNATKEDFFELDDLE